MSDKKIIVAYDGSADSKKALNMGIEIARPLFAKILLVSVYDLSLLNLPDAADIIDFNKLEKSLREIFMERAEDGKKYCEEKEIPVHLENLEGNAAAEIINYAKRENAFMIVAGTRGLGGFNRLLLGSTAQALITYSDISVLIAK